MKMNKKNIWAIAAILVVVCLVVPGLYVYFEYYVEEVVEEEVPEKEIDDRISPLTTQAVFFEINRIRHNGIIDHMMNSGYGLGVVNKLSKVLSKLPDKFWERVRGGELPSVELEDYLRQALDGFRPGFGWREKPVFSYAIVVDDFEWKGTAIYEGWDTDYINQGIFRHVEEEQPTAEIEFKFMRREKKRSGFRVIEQVIEEECFSVVYDFKTGRWAGDDYFNDSDGYGHFNGSKYEMWFNIRQTSYDGDDIPYWTEVNILGTDPAIDDSKLDPDNDGTSTEWEWKWGYDPFKYDNHMYLDPDNDGLQNTEEYFMRKWLANPFHPEMYIETDYTEKQPFKPIKITIGKGKILPIPRPKLERTDDYGWECVFWEESQQMIMERFNEHGITVHIDDGCMGGGGEILPRVTGYGQEQGVVGGFYKNNFADERKGIFRYVFIGVGGGWCHPQDNNHFYDTICVPSKRSFFKNNLCYALSERARRIGRAADLLHELGHSLGIMPDNRTPGCDNRTAEASTVYKNYNYNSVMSYYGHGLRLFDYSDGSHGENDANDWAIIDLTFFQRPSKGMEGIGS